jgi:hypothetical protein
LGNDESDAQYVGSRSSTATSLQQKVFGETVSLIPVEENQNIATFFASTSCVVFVHVRKSAAA